MNIQEILEEIEEYEAMREDEEWGDYLDFCLREEAESSCTEAA